MRGMNVVRDRNASMPSSEHSDSSAALQHDPGTRWAGHFETYSPQEKKDTLMLAGGLIAASGISQMIIAWKIFSSLTGSSAVVATGLLLALGAVSLVASGSAISHWSYKISLAGAICSIFGLFPAGIAGLILLLRSKEDFI